MPNEKKIPYRKKLVPKSSKQLGHGGPRDMQRRQQQSIGMANINMPKVDIGALKEVLLNNKEVRDELKAEIRKEIVDEVREAVTISSKNLEGVGLPFDVVEQKIKEAVSQAEKQTRERYESGLGSLNSQLNAAKVQLKELNSRLSEKKDEIRELRLELKRKDDLLLDKDNTITILREQQNSEVASLKLEIMNLIDKIKNGKLTSENYDDSRPILNDKIFIDPLESVDTDLDFHINVSASEAKGLKRNLKSDVEKLKGLLDNKKYKPSKARIDE